MWSHDRFTKWKETFLGDEAAYSYDTYVNHPSTTEVYYRPKDDLSSYYWAYVDVYPSLSLTGIQNVGNLEYGLLQLAIDGYSKVYHLTKIYQTATALKFHEYRKLIRSINTGTTVQFLLF